MTTIPSTAIPATGLRRRTMPWWQALVMLAAAAALLPLDGPIARAVQTWSPSGDLSREMHAIQQYGQGAVTIMVGAALLCLQPWRWRRLLDLGLAMGLMVLATRLGKHLIGRARPDLEDPWAFVGPVATYDAPGVREPITAWSGNYLLASMPSSHAAAAAVLSIFLVFVDRRLRPLAIALALIVAACRVLLKAHYPSDVVVGLLVGSAIAMPVITRGMGTGLIDLVWKLFDRDATPALPALERAEAAHAQAQARARTELAAALAPVEDR